MGTWADHLIVELGKGEEVVARPVGGSMTPKIKSGDRVRIRPVRPGERFKVGDIVLVRMSVRTVYLHLVSAVTGDRLQISNNHGRVNGWVTADKVHGVYTGPAD